MNMLNHPATRGALLALVLASVALANTAHAQATGVNVINTHRIWFEDSGTVRVDDEGGLAGVLLFKADQRAIVLTDFVMTHNVFSTESTFRVNIRRGPASNANDCDTASAILTPFVSPNETVSINLSTGVRLAPGEQLCVAIGGAPSGQGVSMSITGYQVSPSVGP